MSLIINPRRTLIPQLDVYMVSGQCLGYRTILSAILIVLREHAGAVRRERDNKLASRAVSCMRSDLKGQYELVLV